MTTMMSISEVIANSSSRNLLSDLRPFSRPIPGKLASKGIRTSTVKMMGKRANTLYLRTLE